MSHSASNPDNEGDLESPVPSPLSRRQRLTRLLRDLVCIAILYGAGLAIPGDYSLRTVYSRSVSDSDKTDHAKTLWASAEFGGMPTYADDDYRRSYLDCASRTLDTIGARVFPHAVDRLIRIYGLAAAVLAFAFARYIGFGRTRSTIAAAAYAAAASAMAIRFWDNGVMPAAVLLPLLLLVTRRIFDRPVAVSIGVNAVAIGVLLLIGPELPVLIAAGVATAAAIRYAVVSQPTRPQPGSCRLPACAAACALAVGIAASMYMPLIESMLLTTVDSIDRHGNDDRRAAVRSVDWSGIESALEGDRGMYRINPVGHLHDHDARNGLSMESIGGRNRRILSTYREFRDVCLGEGDAVGLPRNRAILDMLNVRYLISEKALDDVRLRAVPGSSNRGAMVYENPSWLPRVWFVAKVQLATDTRDALDFMNTVAFNPRSVAILERALVEPLEKAGINAVTFIDYRPDHIDLEVSCASRQLLILGEMYYPAGWKATLDGAETTILRANGILRSVVVPAGRHRLRLNFEPLSFRVGRMVSCTAWGLSILLIGYGLIDMSRSRMRPGANQAFNCAD